MTAILKVRNLKAGYKRDIIVNDVSFDIQRGEVFGLVGLNGAGKTTLIKTILGLREKYSGTIEPDGIQSKIAYLPEKFEPSYFLTGEKFIKFSLSLYGLKKTTQEIKNEAEKLSFNPDFLNKSVKTYSKGMRQKIGLLATTMVNCDLTVLDEPMSGLDPKARLEIKKMIMSVKNENRSVFMSSHILADIAELCDRAAIFYDNKIVFIGTPKELLTAGKSKNNPEEAFLNIISKEKAA